MKNAMMVMMTMVVINFTGFSQVVVREDPIPFDPRVESEYSDVLLVINQNSTISDSVGMYFAQMRNIPQENIVRIDAPTREEIDSITFNSIRMQIENYLIQNNLLNHINYIVTTKGVPIRVNRGNTFSTTSPSSSIESELTLILSANASKIGNNGFFTSPYFLSTQKFSRSNYDMFLVTRLDGYTYDDIKNLIDKSANVVWIDSTMQFIFDQDPTWNNSVPFLNNSLNYANTILNSKGLKSSVDKTTLYLTGKQNVLGYASFGSNDNNANQYTQYGRPNNTWANGAIAETYVSTSGRTFAKPVHYGQSVIADVIAEGISGAKGYVYEPYANAMAIVWVLFDRYTEGFNLAESFYASSRALSWMDVVIGDPKMRVFIPKTKVVNLISYRALNSMSVNIEWSTSVEYQNARFIIERRLDAEGTAQNVWRQIGFVTGSGTSIENRNYTYVDKKVKNGNYYYRLRMVDSTSNITYTDSVTVAPFRPIGSGKDEFVHNENVNNFEKNEIKLTNFPNPFNPTTEIKFSIATSGKVSLKIYNSIGQEIATLVNDHLEAGSHSVRFDASSTKGGLSSGIYFSKLETENGIKIQKMSLVK